MKWDTILAVVSMGGFAVQRALEVLDFVLVPTAFGISKAFENANKRRVAANKPEGWVVTEQDAKKWLMAVVGFGIGLLITGFSGIQIVSALDEKFGSLDLIVGALAISGGSEGFNSVLKFAGHVKEARKIEVRPLPEIKVTPAIATVTKGTQLQILANVAGTDIKDVRWELLEKVPGGQVDAVSGLFTAPATTGIFHVAAISTDNPEANAVATITVV
jgi:hypothetical protein